MSFDVILPFLQPIAHLMTDPQVTEIMVNGGGAVFVEKEGVLAALPDIQVNERDLQAATRNIARILGDDISLEKPLLDSRLPDGSRVAVVWPPCSLGGTTLTIRRFRYRVFTMEDLIGLGTLTADVADHVRQAILRQENILISGGTGSGKTTLLNAFAALAPAEDRIVVIEDTAELKLNRPNIVRFEARREQTGLPAVTIRDLLRATLRHRPDRILLGEVRAGEAFDLLQALNTGHAGSLSTIHANSAAQALARFSSCVLQSGVELPYAAIRQQIADTIQWLLHIERDHGMRVVSQLLLVKRYDIASDRYDFAPVYERMHTRDQSTLNR